jgi:hypothetical protein
MVPSEMLRCVALVRTDVSEELSASFIRVTRIGELGTTPALISNQRTLQRNTCRNIPDDTILHSHRRENLKSYISFHVHKTFLRTNWFVKIVNYELTINYKL